MTGYRESLQDEINLEGQEQLVGHCMSDFFLVGRKFWRYLIQGDPTRLLRMLRDSLTMALPRQWWLLPADTIADSVGTVEIRGRREVLLPIDALPLGDPERPMDIATQSDLQSLASLFGGFCCVVRYISYGNDKPQPVGQRVLARSMLPPAPAVAPGAIVYLRSDKAKYYDAMQDYLEERWQVLGPFPSRGKLEDGASIAHCLLISDTLTLQEPGSYVLPGITHIHAHANSFPGLGRQLSVEFSYESGLAELTSTDVEFVVMQLESSSPSFCGPLVVFSACHALGGLGSILVSTAFDLAEAGCRAVVGPRDAIPAAVAYAFSRDLYKGLGQQQEIGRTAVGCRWNLLKSFSNPLGILYSVFGNTAKLIPDGLHISEA